MMPQEKASLPQASSTSAQSQTVSTNNFVPKTSTSLNSESQTQSQTENDLHNHININHTFLCSICQFKFPINDKVVFANHYKNMHSNNASNNKETNIVIKLVQKMTKNVPSIIRKKCNVKHKSVTPNSSPILSAILKSKSNSVPNYSKIQSVLASNLIEHVNEQTVPSTKLVVSEVCDSNVSSFSNSPMVVKTEPCELEKTYSDHSFHISCDLCSEVFFDDSQFQNHMCPKLKLENPIMNVNPVSNTFLSTVVKQEPNSDHDLVQLPALNLVQNVNAEMPTKNLVPNCNASSQQIIKTETEPLTILSNLKKNTVPMINKPLINLQSSSNSDHVKSVNNVCVGEDKQMEILKNTLEIRLKKVLVNRGKDIANNPVILKNKEVFDIVSEMKDIPQVDCNLCVSKFVGWSELKMHPCEIPPPVVKKIRKPKKVSTRLFIGSNPDWSTIKPVAVTCKCTICSKEYFLKRQLKEHYIKFHKKYVCNKIFCTYHYDDPSEQATHDDNSHSKQTTVVCEYCGISVLFWRINEHLKYEHGKTGLICDICQESFTKKSKLYIHIIRHLDYRRFKCHVCKSRFYTCGHLRHHLLIHSKQKFVCKCGKSFNTPLSLTIHINGVHKNSWLLHCKICDQAFKSLKLFSIHYKQHSKEDKFKIKDKNKFYKTSSFQCEFCMMYFKNRTKFVTHLKSKHRINYRQYEKMDAQSKEKLQETGKLEEKKTSFKCPHCTKICSSKRGFKVHLKIHTKKHKHECPICKRTFASHLQMTSHRFSHSKQSEYKCYYCNFKSNDKIKLRKHILKLHLKK